MTGSRWRSAFAAMMIMVALAAAGCGPKDGPAPAATTSSGVRTAPAPQPAGPEALAAAKKFAPLVRLGNGEKHRPMDAGKFIDKSSLRWNRNLCPDEEIDPDPTAAKLADPNAYRARETGTVCTQRDGQEYDTTQATRPFDNEKTIGAEGYFLDADNDVHEPEGKAPTYLQLVPSDGGKTGYVFWFFYPYNRWTNPVGGVGGNHEGDWERVTVVVDQGGQPTGVVFSQHLTKCLVPWSEVASEKGHPVVYSALGSHGSYPVGDARYKIDKIPGLKVLQDKTSTKGEAWRTWETVKDVQAEPWWNYAGGWGEVGGGPVPSRTLLKTQTGPAGPSPHKIMTSEVTKTDPCPSPESVESWKPKGSPETKAGAIDRFEAFLHAVGRKEVKTVCEIAGPAAKQAEDAGFGPCEVTMPITFGLIGEEGLAALKKATVDPDQVRKKSDGTYEIPASAVQGAYTFSDSDLGDCILEYRDDDWFVID